MRCAHCWKYTNLCPLTKDCILCNKQVGDCGDDCTNNEKYSREEIDTLKNLLERFCKPQISEPQINMHMQMLQWGLNLPYWLHILQRHRMIDTDTAVWQSINTIAHILLKRPD